MGNQDRQVILMAVQPPSSLADTRRRPLLWRKNQMVVQVDAQRGTAEELAFRVYGRAHVARPQTRRGNSTSPALKLFAAGQKGM
jgi:hypothetical protein